MNNTSHTLIDQGVAEGKPFPLGAVCTADGVNFSVYSKNGIAVELLLFDHVDDAHPSYLIPLDRATHQPYLTYAPHEAIRSLRRPNSRALS